MVSTSANSRSLGVHPKNYSCRPNRTRLLVSRGFFLSVWLLLGVITVLHYTAPMHAHWAHDVLRRAYYLPIVIAAMRNGLFGGLVTTGVVIAAYLPHAFFYHELIDPADGLEKSLEMVLYLVVASVAGYLSDMECRRRAQLVRAVEEQKSLTRQLARAGRLAALGEVVAGIAHEIKNPLHALAGTAEIVDPEIAEESEVRPMWEIHKSEIERLKRTADTFLSFARPQPISSDPLDLGAVAARLEALVAAETRQKGIALEVHSRDEPLIVKGDVDQLAQVALNVTVNAIRAIGEGGGVIRVTLGTQSVHHNEMAFLSIENNGPPIPEEARDHLFDPFHSSTDGTGLGLSISDRIIQQHGGYFDVSEGDLGVAFTFYLPAS